MELSVFSDEHFMREALKEAQKAFDEGEVPVGAVLVCNNRIIGRGYNQVEKLTDATAHAEMIAITSAFNYLSSKVLEECTLFVTLEPCTMCAGAIFWARPSRLVFGASDTKRGFSVFSSKIIHPKTEVTFGVLKEESENILKEFFLRLRE